MQETEVNNTAEPAGSLLSNSEIRAWLPDFLQPFIDVLANYPLLMILVLLSAGYIVGKLLQFVLSRGMANLAGKTETEFDDRLIVLARKPVLTITVIISMLIAVSLLALPEGIYDGTVRVLATILLFSVARAVLKTVHMLLELIASNHERFEIVQERTIPLFEMTLKVVVVAAVAYMFLVTWGINPTAWLASAGVIGIAVGFAAKDSLANLFSGVFIVADAPYKIGDYIVLDSGERGAVISLGMRSTRLLTRDDVEITIPNAVIANSKITNESGGPWEKERIRVPVGVSYGSDVDQVCELLKNIALEHPEIMKTPEPRVRLRSFGASSLDFELMGWIDHPELRGRIRHELHMNIYKGFAEAGVEIPFPQQDVHVKSMPIN
jgi:small-conductance mechanosensitive channel